MAPIRKGDGTGISDVRLGDGTQIGEVRKGDGTVLWSRGADIPDSAIHQWPMDEGGGTTVADSIGSADISLTGTTWDDTTDSWKGGWATEYDGTDDNGVADSGRTDPGDSGSLVLTVRFRSLSGNKYVFSHPGFGGDNRLYVRHKADTGEGLNVTLTDDTDVTVESNPSTDTTYRIGVTWDSGTMTGYLNGQNINSKSYVGSLSATTEGWFFGTLDGDIRDLLDGYIDNPVMADEAWTDTEMQDDYEQQPWS